MISCSSIDIENNSSLKLHISMPMHINPPPFIFTFPEHMNEAPQFYDMKFQRDMLEIKVPAHLVVGKNIKQ